jgi:3-isopropylmalate dehydrogenase
MLLEHLGHADEAKRVEEAVAPDLATRGTAPRRTSEVGDALAAAVG